MDALRMVTLDRYARLLARYLRPHRLRMILLAATLCGTISVQAVTPLVVARFLDRAVLSAAQNELSTLALLSIALALVGQGIAIAETYAAENISWAATNALRADLIAHLLRLDAAFHTAHTPSNLIERVDGDVGTLARLFSRFVIHVLGNGLLIAAVLGLLYLVDWRVGLAFSAFVALGFIVGLRIHAVAAPMWARERQADADFYGFLGEYLAGTEDVRSCGAGAFVLRRCAERMRAWLAVRIRAGMWGARVFLRDPDVVILDEASSRLDPATERLVHAALGRLLEGRTGIIVAHRLATMAYADDILVLDGGRVCEHGPRRRLAADPGSRFSGLLRAAGEGVAL